MITNINQLDFSKKYTYTDYMTWHFEERVELFKGKINPLSTPGTRHQLISGNVLFKIASFVKNTAYQVYHAPFDVRLFEDTLDTVVQPDICVIGNPDKLDEQGCLGAPDIAIEILSPLNLNVRKEVKEKFELYQEAGVREYWLVDTSRELVIIYHLTTSNRFIGSKPYVAGEIIHSKVLPGLKLPVKEVFEQ